MNLFRGILKSEEISDRGFALSDKVLELNPANYTAWFFRRVLLDSLYCNEKGSQNMSEDAQKKYKLIYGMTSIDVELERVGNLILDGNFKNYQVWYHRQCLIERLFNFKNMLFSENPQIPAKDISDEKLRFFEKELFFVERCLEEDPKNYHVWQYRQWAVLYFAIWNHEMEIVNSILKQDPRNNSAWNHRFFVIRHKFGDDSIPFQDRENEISEVFNNFINLAPNNESPWNYVYGIANWPFFKSENGSQLRKKILEKLENCAMGVYNKTGGCNVHCLWVLVECNLNRAEIEPECKMEFWKRGKMFLERLGSVDGVRGKYWNWRLQTLLKLIENN